MNEVSRDVDEVFVVLIVSFFTDWIEDSPGDSSGAGLSAADRENRSELSAADDAKMKEAGKLIRYILLSLSHSVRLISLDRYHLQNYRVRSRHVGSGLAL